MSKDREFVKVPCILCGRDNSHLISNKGHLGLPIHVSICRNDGLVYLNPRWTDVRYQQFYSKEYDKCYRPQVHSEESDEHKYATITQIWNRLRNSNFDAPKSVLDIGSGMGWSLDYIAKQVKGDLSMAAIEASAHCAQNIIDKVGAQLLAKTVDSNWHEHLKDRFDLVIMRHVLEHFLNPVEVLQKVCRVLAPNGIVYIAVPDMLSPKGSLHSYWFRVVHTYYFCQPTLSYLAAQAGLEPLKIQAENSEVWALFTKARSQRKCRVQSIYTQQIETIRAYRIRRFLKDAVIFSAKRVASRLRGAKKYQ